jgi:DNA-binding response OmpR family regulator
MVGPHARLDGLRVLVVEDEFLVSIALEQDLGEAGATVIGPCNDLAHGLALARSEAFDVAVLDINLDGTLVYPLADVLNAGGVPFVFLSGYTAADLPLRFAAHRRLSKPYEPSRLIEEIARLTFNRGDTE